MALKHSKYRNTGILFELLVRQTTSDLLNNQDSKSVKILKKYFTNTELGKEYGLYSAFSTSPKLTEAKAEILVSTLIEQYKKLDYEKINKLLLLRFFIKPLNLITLEIKLIGEKEFLMESKLIKCTFSIFIKSVSNGAKTKTSKPRFEKFFITCPRKFNIVKSEFPTKRYFFSSIFISNCQRKEFIILKKLEREN